MRIISLFFYVRRLRTYEYRKNTLRAMACSDDEVLARMGIMSAEPFDWGGESQTVVSGVNTSNLSHNPSPPLSGLDSIKAYVQDINGTDISERGILQSLFGDVLSTPSLASKISSQSSAIDHWQQALMDDTVWDMSIKGLSDRAVAELNVESRASLFGSILRLFDMPRDGENNGNREEGDRGALETSADATSVGEAAADSTIVKEPILSTAEIVRSVHLTARPGDVPAGMDSKEYTMSVLHFMSSCIPYLHEDEKVYRDSSGSQEGWDQLRKTLPVLPLIKAINPSESLELRCYGRVRPLVKLGEKERKQHPESMDHDEAFRKKVLNLERIYSSSLPFSSSFTSPGLSSKLFSVSTGISSELPLAAPSAKRKDIAQQQGSDNDLPFAFQRYVARRKLVPHIEGGHKEELTLMISGHMQQPQHTPGPKRSKPGANSASPTM